MSKSFLCVGECMVEVAPAEGGFYKVGFAGDTFNTAWYARRLLGAEWQVGYCSAVGTDAASDEMVAFMQAAGIDTAAVRRVSDRTVGLYMISLTDGERSFSYWRGQSAAKTLADDPAWLDTVLTGRNTIQFSGITVAIQSPRGRDALCAALAKARASGATVAFDTNLRPRLWRDNDEMREGLLQAASVADVVLPSFDEETWLFGDATPADTIARYAEAGARVVAVKNGSGACHIWQDGNTFVIDPPKVTRVVDSTAAGDSFGAGFLAGLATGADVETAGRQAAGLAAQVIQRRGALAPEIFENGENP